MYTCLKRFCTMILAHSSIPIFYAMLLVLHCFLPPCASAQMFRPDRTDTGKRCAICHFEWVYAFFTEHRDGELVPQPEGELVATPAMCFSCHDGSVADSRKIVFHDPGHRTGIAPSGKVTIPKEFPLDGEGNLQCATCHTPHAVESRDGTSVEFFLRSSNTNSSFCKVCHSTMGGGKEKGNHPTDISLKSIPTPLMEAGGQLGTDQPNQIICETCHIPHGGINDKFLVLSIEDPSTRSVLCEVCHTSSPGRSKDPLPKHFSHPINQAPGKTVSLPDQWPGGEKIFYGRRGELVCRTCHKPHGAPSSEYLLIEQGEKDSQCRECHPGEVTMVGSSHDLRKSAPEARNILDRPARETGPCGSCHSAHSGSAPFIWARTAPVDKESASHFCTGCHARGECAESSLPKEFSHPMEVKVTESLAPLKLPLFDSNGRKSRTGTISCATCHDIHNPQPVSTGTVEAGNPREGFLRLTSPEGPAGICMHCHAQQAMVKGGKHDLTIMNAAFTNVLNRIPAQDGVCSACHVSHGAVSERYLWAGLLQQPKPAYWDDGRAIDTQNMVRFCSGCHNGENPTGTVFPPFGFHPPDMAFPYGKTNPVCKDMPLYTAQGEVSAEGDITCSTCHNPHQWRGDGMVDGTALTGEGTASDSFLRPGVGELLCAVCHGEEALMRFLYFHRFQRSVKEAPFPQLKRKR